LLNLLVNKVVDMCPSSSQGPLTQSFMSDMKMYMVQQRGTIVKGDVMWCVLQRSFVLKLNRTGVTDVR